jgi:hypothetical protein
VALASSPYDISREKNDGKLYTVATSVQNLIAYWNQGTLIEVDDSLPNPETPYHDEASSPKSIWVNSLLEPQTG